jgi:hypothetical protein
VLAKDGVPVLGGDVYRLVKGRPEMARENWYCEQQVGEGLKDFVTRSHTVASTFVKSYAPKGQDFAFTVVPRQLDG